jgi:mannitol-1-phosphate 5-dehydrogenase
VVTTEPFNELAVGADADIPGIDSVPDVDTQFARKRYLVNTFADASAVLGVARGHRTLAEAIADAAIQHRIAPLLGALELHLVLACGFERDALESYLARSRRRLANTAIPRRLDTVSRDFWRKLGPSERFAEPLIDLESRGRLDDGAVEVIAALVRAAMPDGTANSAPAHGGVRLSPPAVRFYARLDAALAR